MISFTSGWALRIGVGLVERLLLQVVARAERGHLDVGVLLLPAGLDVLLPLDLLAAVSEAVMIANSPLPPRTRAALSISVVADALAASPG